VARARATSVVVVPPLSPTTPPGTTSPAAIAAIRRGFFAAIPAEIEEAAWMDGASKLTTMRKVTLPLALPGLVTCVIFTFVAAWNEFAMARALVFGNRSRWPLTLGLSDFTQLYEDEWNYLFAASLIAIVPVVLLFAAIERYLVKGLTAGAIR
jgi:multiple sugar transport system permease protein